MAEVCDGGRSPALGPVMVDNDNEELVVDDVVVVAVAVAGSKGTVEPPATRTVPLVVAFAFWELVAAPARLLLCCEKASDAAWELEAATVSLVELLVRDEVKDGLWVVEVTSISTYTMIYQ